MGAADVVPGVSGGTMALILRIYPQLIDAIKSFDRAWLRAVLRLDIKQALSRPHLAFLLPLFVGIFSALLFFTRVLSLPNLLKTHPELIYGLFFGLIVGSVIILLRELKRLRASDLGLLLLGAAMGIFVFNLVPVETPETAWFIFISGALAICAMMLPGISGAFILLILNKYAYIFNAIGYLQFGILLPFGLGCLAGLVLFSRLLSCLLHHYYRRTMLLITGILIASLQLIWPFQERVYAGAGSSEKLISTSPVFPPGPNATLLGALAMMALGLLAVLAIHHYAQRPKALE